MSSEDFISKHWEMNSDQREPYMDAPPAPLTQGHFDPRYEDLIREGQMRRIEESPEERQIKECINRLAQTPDGYYVLRWLCKFLGFKESVLSMVDGKPSPNGMIWNEARRMVWNDVRQKLNLVNRNKVEEDK